MEPNVRSRNLVFLRSILFGAFARIGGLLTVVVGLPVISRALPPDQYASFLRSVSIVAFGTLVYGAANITTVRKLADALEKNDTDGLVRTERETATFFLIVFAIAAIIALPAFVIAGVNSAAALALLTAFLLTQSQGILTWSESYRVALRSDHKNSSWQLIGSTVMVALLVGFSHLGLWATLLIYFGIPLLSQIGVTVQLARERPLHVRPLFHLDRILNQSRTAIPVLLYGGTDYVKIFGSGLVVSMLTDNYEFAYYSTIALFVSRLVNPLALITRPLLPAFINARHERDAAWMRGASHAVILVSAGSIIGLLGVSFLFGPHLLDWILREPLGSASLVVIICGAFFLWGHAIATLLVPFYIASGREAMLSAANAGFVSVGILSGAIATQYWGSVGMLLCMGVTCSAMAATLLIYSITKVLRIRDQKVTEHIEKSRPPTRKLVRTGDSILGIHGFTWYWNRFKSYVGRPRMVVQTRAVVVDDDTRCEEPVFIVGAHRSGTSLVRRMFNSHPEIACPPESFFITRYAAMLDDRHVQAGYDGFGYDSEQMRLDLALKASSLHEAYRTAHGKRIWADKTPDYSLHLEAIDRLFAARPRYVLVLRHPGDAVHSIYRRGWRLNAIEDRFESALQHVRHCIDAILDFESQYPERCVRIVYEDLCDRPEQILTAALSHLDLPFNAEMLRFADHDHNFGLEDPVVRGMRKIEPRHGAWRSLSRAHQARIVETFGSVVEGANYWRTESA